MEDPSKQILRQIIKLQLPDMSNVKPPTELAVKKMIRNLHAAANK